MSVVLSRSLCAAVAVNAVMSQLLLRRASRDLVSPGGLSALPRFLAHAALSPWIYASVTLQVLGYVLWIVIVSREKLGVAVATVGGGFYVLVALSAWGLFGETLSILQWFGILLVSIGVVCVSQGAATS